MRQNNAPRKRGEDLGKLLPCHLSKHHRLRLQVFLRDDFTCQYCGRFSHNTKLTLDHLLPRDQKGETTVFNLVTCCPRCNQDKDGEAPPNVDQDLKLLESRQREFQAAYPTVQAVLDRYVALIQEDHRLARITYFRAYNFFLAKQRSNPNGG